MTLFPPKTHSTYRNSLSNSLSRIFNAYQRSFEEESIPFSLINIQLISSFTNAGYVSGCKVCNTQGTHTNLQGKERTQYEASNQDLDACLDASLSSDGRVHDRDASAFIRIYLKYYQGRPAIRGLSQISKPGKRIFVSKKKLLKISEAGS
jgi:ribosomal protein S8